MSQPHGRDLELALLLDCARLAAGAEPLTCRRRLSPEILDYTYLLWAARAHGLLPLLQRYLDVKYHDDLPPTILENLREQTRENARRNALLTAEMLELLQLFGSCGIVAVPFKGPTLAILGYGNLALRQFGDLDLLVRRADVGLAGRLLRARGYLPPGEMTDAQEIAYVRLQVARTYSHRNGAVVDLHWRLATKRFFFAFEFEQLWERLQCVSVGGTLVRTLSPEDLLLFLCAHGARHCWGRLSWIADIGALIQAQPTMDWSRATGEARRLGGYRMLLLGLLLASEVGGAPMPESMIKLARRDSRAVALAKQVREQIFSRVGRGVGTVEALCFHLRANERLAHRLRFLGSCALSPSFSDFKVLPLPTAFWSLYHVVRPFRLAARYATVTPRAP